MTRRERRRGSWWLPAVLVPLVAALAACNATQSGQGAGATGGSNAPTPQAAQATATAPPQVAAAAPPAMSGEDAAPQEPRARRDRRGRHDRYDGGDRQDRPGRPGDRRPRPDAGGFDPRRAERSDRRVQAAFAAGPVDVAAAQSGHVHGRLVEFDATVVRVLRDDERGLRHQRFLVTTPATGTLLIAHNTDLAAKVPLAVGDRVHVRGLFEWNPKGGVVHWTHHDPSGKTAGGFIRLREQTYQ